MEDRLEELEGRIGELGELVSSQEKVIASHQGLLARLLLSTEVRPTGALAMLHDLCLELMQFVHHVCVKHRIAYWLDCGSLLGSVRHGGFIPWDDDIDLAMARPDFLRFLKVLGVEIAKSGLADLLTPTRLRFNRTNSRIVSCHLQLKYGTSNFTGAMLDVFPYDYLSDEGAAAFDPTAIILAARRYRRSLTAEVVAGGFTEYRGRKCQIGGGISAEELKRLTKRYKALGINLKNGPYLTPGLDSVKYRRVVPVADVMPVAPVAFGDREFFAPRNARAYLTGLYGREYLDLPQAVELHDRLDWMRRNSDLESKMGELHERLASANDRFRSRTPAPVRDTPPPAPAGQRRRRWRPFAGSGR